MVWIEDQTSYNISLSQNLIQSKALILFNFMKLEEVRKLQKKSLKLAEDGSQGTSLFKERHHLYNIKVPGEASITDVEAAANYPKDLANSKDNK